MQKNMLLFVVVLASIISTTAFFTGGFGSDTVSANSMPSQSIEQQLIDGADPTLLFEATAAGQRPDCTKVHYGVTENSIAFVRDYGGNIYVAEIDGQYRTFERSGPGAYVDEIKPVSDTRRLKHHLDTCNNQKAISANTAGVKFLTMR